MALEQILIIIILVLIAVFAWAIFKKVFKLVLYVGLIIFLLLAANIYFIYKDVTDLRENFAVETKKVILVDEDEILTGLLLDGEINLMTNEQLNDFSSYLEDENYEEILGTDYKLMIFDVEIISNVENDIEFGDETISPDEAIMILKSETTENEMKASLFGLILADEILSSKNPLFFFSEIKKGNIIVYPKTALFKIVKFVPTTFIKNIGEKILYKTKEKAKSFVVEESV